MSDTTKNTECDKFVTFKQVEKDYTLTVRGVRIPGCFKCLFSDGGSDVHFFLGSLLDFLQMQIHRIEKTFKSLEPIREHVLPFKFDEETGALQIGLEKQEADMIEVESDIKTDESMPN